MITPRGREASSLQAHQNLSTEITRISLPLKSTHSFWSLEANQNFSKVAKVVDEHGTAVILKNNVPRYLVIDFSKAEKEKVANSEDVFAISERLIKQNMEAYEVLAK